MKKGDIYLVGGRMHKFSHESADGTLYMYRLSFTESN